MELILYIVIGVCLLGVLIIVLRKIPQLRVIDVTSIPKERARRKKEELILSKFQRKGGAKLKRVGKSASGAVNVVSKVGRRAVQRLYRLEQYYQKLKRTANEGMHAYADEQIKERLGKASELIKQEEYIPAEKIFIDIISHNPKSVDAYEQLGNMYLSNDQPDQAKETLKFALRLSPNDASVNVSLAELAMKQDDAQLALEYLRKAIEKRSKNPRYLDYYIEAALQAGSLKDARKGIKDLKEVNPDNKKIKEFENRFQEKKASYISKTSSEEKKASQSK
ncbi:MAG: tetratricopeptide repeat protein [bacterium]|jgi:predicted Zn-dependent protease|nr:tetratricopeptide repeat protein [bacterium]